MPERLQQALLPVVAYERCSQPDWWGTLAIRSTMICAGGAEKAGCNVSATPGWGGREGDTQGPPGADPPLPILYPRATRGVP